jgi:predicted amidohydrolase YtcJ
MVKQFFSGCALVSKLQAGTVISIIAVLLFLAGCEQESVEEQPAGADLILKNGVIYTQDDINSQVEALAVTDGRITAIGTNDAISTQAGKTTKIVDLDGRFVMPGINDGHSHPAWGGVVALYYCLFPATASADEVAAKIKGCVSESDELWIQGGLWTPNFFEEYAIDSPRAWLDDISGDKAIVLKDDSGHNCWANSKALDVAGIDEQSVPPAGGIYEKTSAGDLNGLIQEACSVIDAQLPQWTAEHYKEGARYAVANANGYGVTGFKDASSSEAETSAYFELDKAGALSLNVATCLYTPEMRHGEVNTAVLEQLRDDYASAHVHTSFAKIFLDGVPTTARTAAMIEPYIANAGDVEAVYGPTHLTQNELNAALIKLDAHGFTVKIHTAGDRSVRMGLNAIEAARKANGASSRRHELGHAGFIAKEDIPRFAELNAVADLSPYLWFPSPIIDSVRKALGARGFEYWPTRDLLKSGAPLLAGSDWPSVSQDLNPWVGLEAMVTRQDPVPAKEGNTAKVHGWIDQSLTVREAIKIYTIDGARALGLHEQTGSLVTGKSADFIILNHNLLEIPPEKIDETEVQMTYFEGRLVYEK